MVIQPMGPLQSGIPLPSLLLKGWPLIVIDLKDCFFTIPLQEKDREKFAFTVPTYKNFQPTGIYQWTILPQGMLSSPTLGDRRRWKSQHNPTLDIMNNKGLFI